MNQNYPSFKNQVVTPNKLLSPLRLSLMALLLLLSFTDGKAQTTYTVGYGTLSSETLGVSPFATINMNSRSQYIYYNVELQDEGASAGYITAIAVNITSLALPTTLHPQNVTVKMGQTFETIFGPAMATGLQTVYTTSVENITELGWHTITLDTPFARDGTSHIVVEICRSNDSFGTNFAVEAEQYGLGDYRTVGLYSNQSTTAGCDLTGTTLMSNAARRTRPNMQFTLAQICDGLPNGGTAVVGAGPYCEEGQPITVSVTGADLSSGLSYQWQSSPHTSGPWSDILGAWSETYTGTQTVATYYRRSTLCEATGEAAFSNAVFVNGQGCYCAAPLDTANPVGITQVSFASINNFSASNNSYSYYNVMAEVVRENTYNLSCTVNTAGGTNYTKAWIDWNDNGDFEASEMYDLGSVTGGANVSSGAVASVTVPASAPSGIRMLRVRTQQSPGNVGPDACGNIVTGETEDYSIFIDQLGIGVITNQSASLLVFGDADGLQVKMRNGVIDNVEVFDISGRLLMTKNDVNAPELKMSEFKGSHSILVVKVTDGNGAVVSKKVVL